MGGFEAYFGTLSNRNIHKTSTKKSDFSCPQHSHRPHCRSSWVPQPLLPAGFGMVKIQLTLGLPAIGCFNNQISMYQISVFGGSKSIPSRVSTKEVTWFFHARLISSDEISMKVPLWLLTIRVVSIIAKFPKWSSENSTDFFLRDRENPPTTLMMSWNHHLPEKCWDHLGVLGPLEEDGNTIAQRVCLWRWLFPSQCLGQVWEWNISGRCFMWTGTGHTMNCKFLSQNRHFQNMTILNSVTQHRILLVIMASDTCWDAAQASLSQIHLCGTRHWLPITGTIQENPIKVLYHRSQKTDMEKDASQLNLWQTRIRPIWYWPLFGYIFGYQK